MEPEGTLQHSQEPATCPYPGPNQSSPCAPHSTSLKSIFILFSQLRLGLPSGLFPSGFPTKTLYTPLHFRIHAVFPAHHNRLDLITRTILGEEYRTLSSSLCSFLHFPVNWSLLRQNKGLFEMIVGVLTICHKQYAWDRSIRIFYLIEQ